MRRDRDRGKMNKWFRLRNLIHGADVIVEVLDARDAHGTRLPIAEKWAGTKRLMILANKADLLAKGEKVVLPPKSILASAKSSSNEQRLALIAAIVARSENRPVKALFIGYPNVGKSSLINMLAMRKAARVSHIAGTTTNIQWVRVSEELLASDYRGLFPEAETHESLVRKSAINVQGEEELHAYKFAQRVLERPKLRAWLEKRYDLNLDDAKNAEDVLKAIAERRKFYLKGGELNIPDAARSLLRAMAQAPEI
jgi:ribosome biogenesis GTPase A